MSGDWHKFASDDWRGNIEHDAIEIHGSPRYCRFVGCTVQREFYFRICGVNRQVLVRHCFCYEHANSLIRPLVKAVSAATHRKMVSEEWAIERISARYPKGQRREAIKHIDDAFSDSICVAAVGRAPKYYCLRTLASALPRLNRCVYCGGRCKLEGFFAEPLVSSWQRKYFRKLWWCSTECWIECRDKKYVEEKWLRTAKQKLKEARTWLRNARQGHYQSPNAASATRAISLT